MKSLANKIENYAHCYDDVSKNKNESVFKSFIEKGIHADGRNTLVETPEELLLTVPLEFREKILRKGMRPIAINVYMLLLFLAYVMRRAGTFSMEEKVRMIEF